MIARWKASSTGETQPGSGDTSITTYTWDNRNRVVAVDSYATFAEYNANTPTQTVLDTYDVENRWIGETVTTYVAGTTTVNQSTQQEFVYDSDQIVLQFSKTTTGAVGTTALGNANLSERYLWGPAVDQLFAQECRVLWRVVFCNRCGRLGLDGQSGHGPRPGGLQRRGDVNRLAFDLQFVRQPGESDQPNDGRGADGGLPLRLHRPTVRHRDGPAE